MINTYIIALATVAFIMLVSTVIIASKRKLGENKLYSSIIQLFIVAIFACIAYCVSIGSRDLMKAEIAYSFYFASMDWLLISMINYARQYTKVWLDNKSTPLMMATIAALDNVSLFTNSLWHHAFSCYRYETGDGDWCYLFEMKEFFYAHLAFCYILVFVVIAIFFSKAVYSGGFKKSRYLVVFIVFVAIIVMNAVFLLFDFALDISMCFYSIATIFIGYFSVAHNPRAFAEYMLTTITERMDCALIAFDENDSCIYANQLAQRLFSTNSNRRILDDRFKKWKEGREANSIPDGSWNDMYELSGEECRFDVHFNKIYDKKGYYCGCYFSYYDITSDYVAYEEEKYRSSHDALTGALNRESFYADVRELLNRYPTTDYILFCCNIKGFKLINDVFGLDVADKILIKVADTIREKIKAGSSYARLEADRFAVFMPKERYSEEIIQRGINEVENTINNTKYRMTIHVGVYEVYDRDATVASMCDRAFLAIDSIKDSFKNEIAYYGDMLRHEYMNEQRIIAEFEHALSDGQFAMFLQPLINKDGDAKLAEALVRWVHPDRGILPPGAFITALENTGYIYKLDRYIWEQAVRRLAYWSSLEREDLSISVNISVKDFYFVDVYDTMVSLVEKYNVNPERLKLEITESVFMTEKERQLEIINSLKNYGFLIEIDDFGSGYSSLNMLKELPANILKIDMAFLSIAGDEIKGKKIINSMISLAKALDMLVVVEGVETQTQVDYLREAGCDLLQGYYFDKPLPVKQFEEKYL